jgi:hypothetical protein
MKNREYDPYQVAPVIRTQDVGDNIHHYIVVLRDDQLEAIRQIVREEIRAALAE